MLNGILVINKPKGMTSHDVVAVVRGKLKMKRVGHAGTLDPLATGVLVLLVGPSTKLFDRFVAFDKGYQATLRLGLTTDTADILGKEVESKPLEGITRESVERVFEAYMGVQQQTPPMYSAVKVKGKRLYKLARKGIEVKRMARTVHVKRLDILDFALPDIRFYLECSKGTYVRKLAEDIGQDLGCGGCIAQINRTKIGPFTIDDAVDLDNVNESHLRQFTNARPLA